MEEFFGLLGLILIVLAWIPGVAETIRTKKTAMTMEFIAIYFLGSLSLTVYGWQLNSLPFVILNGIAAIVPLVHAYYLIFGKTSEKTPDNHLK